MLGMLYSVPLILRQATVNPCLCQRPMDTPRTVLLSLLWGHLPLSWVLVWTKFCLCSLRVCFPVLWNFCNQIPLAFKTKDKSSSLVWSLGPGVHQVLFESPEHLWHMWGLILNVIVLLLPPSWHLVLLRPWIWGIFFDQIQLSPADGYPVASCNFGVFAGQDERMFFYLPSCELTQLQPRLPRKQKGAGSLSRCHGSGFS